MCTAQYQGCPKWESIASQRYSFDSHMVQAQVQPINSMVGDKPEKPRKHDPSDCSTMSISIIANVPSDSMYMLKASCFCTIWLIAVHLDVVNSSKSTIWVTS